MSKHIISTILLAAGQSKRMGRPKLLLPYQDSTILEKAIDNLLNSSVDEIIVVLGYQAQKMLKAIDNRPVKIVMNPFYPQGMSTSIVQGLDLVDHKAVAVMLALADQPLVDSATINKIIEGFLNHKKGIIIPVYKGERGHPIIFSIKYKDKLLGLKGDIGGRQIVKNNPDDILEVTVNCKGINFDVDIMYDYYYHDGNGKG